MGDFDRTLIADTQRETARAYERAAVAIDEASQADERSGQANVRAGEANAKAEQERLNEAQRELLVSPRRLTVDEEKRIGSACASLYTYGPSKRIVIQSYGMDGEGAVLAQQIGVGLNSSRLYTQVNIGALVQSGGFDSGVLIAGPPEDDEFTSCLDQALVNIGKLKEVTVNGAVHTGTTMSGGAMMSGSASMGGGGGIRPAGPRPAGSQVVIMIGIKPQEIPKEIP